uniref:Thiol:disulfide interchange protein n=1 Tax=Vertebrata lanosa TaxID=1261582 RepID=A0A0B5VV12_9FLOR|nr:thiol:disulfide interchange protein [Vertebrata lanosa]AJH66033.1 thiol:disulfide interchange protein [Vertebrata lanosa]
MKVHTYFNNFFDNYYIILYYCQYYLSKLILLSHNSSSLLLILIFFIFGSMTVFTPCFISMMPLALSYVLAKGNFLINIIIFSLGLSTSSFIFLLLVSIIGSYTFVSKFALFSNVFTILIALDLMKIISFSNIYSFLRLPKNILFDQSTFFHTYFIGLIIGFSALPCNTSTFFIISFLSKNIHNILTLFIYLFTYTLGFISPLFLIFSFKLYSTSLNLLSGFWNFIYSFAGSFFFIFSLFSLLNSVFS